jgi:phage-related protein
LGTTTHTANGLTVDWSIRSRVFQSAALSHRDVAKWAQTSVQMVADFYDHAHPERVAERVAGFRRGFGGGER